MFVGTLVGSATAGAATAFNVDALPCILQVYKGIKNGVQDVAVKVLINSDDIQVKLFQEVSHGCTFCSISTCLYLAATDSAYRYLLSKLRSHGYMHQIPAGLSLDASWWS